MSDFIDLHCHYLPGVDDGVRSVEDAVRLCSGLRALGYAKIVATPHMRTAMFPNERSDLEPRFAELVASLRNIQGLPELGLAAEHFFDDVFFERMRAKTILPFPGGAAALVELPGEQIPLPLGQCFFEMNMQGIRPVLAHPERYAPVAKSLEVLDPLRDAGAFLQLDLMSLSGRYGRRPRKTAEALLEDGGYFLACTDAHKPEDVDIVAGALETLRAIVGDTGMTTLLVSNPRAILDGTAEP